MSATKTAPAPAAAECTSFSGANRRRHPREPHHVAATIQPATGNADVDEAVSVFNLSLGGAGIVVARRYAVGSVWRITLGNGPLFLNARMRVVSCRPRSDGKYDVGCEFC